ncbi:MAG: hypothetical protein RL660_1873, partial [Bacteroidota bacterium]
GSTDKFDSNNTSYFFSAKNLSGSYTKNLIADTQGDSS